MTNENNEVEKTTVEETQEENAVEEETVVETEKTTTEGDEDIHAKELADLQAKNKKLEDKLADKKFKGRQENKEEEKEEKPDTSKFVTKDDLAKHERLIFQSQIDNEINNRTDSDSEKELIKYHLENSISPSGDIKVDVENAQLLANKRKILQENQMAKREVISNQNKGTGSNASQKQTTNNEPKLSTSDAKMLKVANLKFNPKTGRYEGKKTFFDPKSGKSGLLE